MLSSYTASRWIVNLIFDISSSISSQMLPFTPISEELLPSSWIQEEYPILKQVFCFLSFPQLLLPHSGLHPARPPTLRGLEGICDHGTRDHRPRSSLGRGAAVERLRRWEHKVKHVVLDRDQAWVKRLSRLHNQASTTNKQPNGETHNSPSC